jgi:hypothetical protein
MEKNNFKRNLFIAFVLGAAMGYGVIQGYFFILFSAGNWMPLWLVKIYVYIFMFPSPIAGMICNLRGSSTFGCIPYMRYVFPITYATIFPLIYYIYHRIKTRKSP